MFQQGDIVVVPFPFTDLSSKKLRPAVIVSKEEKMKNTGDVIIVMITTKPKKNGINILIEKNDVTIDLPVESFVRCHRIATIDEKIILKKISVASKKLTAKIISSVGSLMS